jgi:hypothetical protein
MLARASMYQTKKDYFSFHRASAASLAIRERSFADNLCARALPPFDAPSFERATAAGFFFFGERMCVTVYAKRREALRLWLSALAVLNPYQPYG